MKIGFRTIKTAIGIALSIAIAKWLGLEFYTSAGIITILCIKTTKKQSYQTAWELFFGSLVGLGISAIVFEWIGYHTWTLTILLLLLIPMSVYLKISDGIVTSTVVILHLFILKKVNIDVIVNEILLLVLGVGMGILLNIYMPSLEKELRAYQRKIESNFKTILREFAAYLYEPERYWDGKEILETAQWLMEAKELAILDMENQDGPTARYFYHYFEMRERQFEILERIAPIVSALDRSCEQGEMIARFLENLADAVHPGNTAHLYLEELEKLREDLRNSLLPQTREEFETRAALFHFINEMRRYLIIKRNLLRDWEELINKKEKSVFAQLRWIRK
ncbi:aromatic acid exporter family protein [Thermoactinomyces mirandus]|uniref:Aromatic acid exporter family protein n=1 Tax=Thermoactinomyces mirandus TaxID=2756294 RepID=A0A7W1XR95_9BACL|nr:aromatic acid exporter family protein [Thermoactinomyces mirandus]MBA4601680.1 aromatic acid exporter family protein [Thermoactinomyces mirandus]